MKKMILLVVLVLLGLGALVANAKAAGTDGVLFNETSTVVISQSGFAVITNGQAVTGWFGANETIKTSDGGQIVILMEVRDGKKIGPIGWRYSNGTYSRSGAFQPASFYLPVFKQNSSIMLGANNQLAVVENGVRTSNWVPMNGTFLTTDGGQIIVLMEVRDGKKIGPIGWRYSNGTYSRSGAFGFGK